MSRTQIGDLLFVRRNALHSVSPYDVFRLIDGSAEQPVGELHMSQTAGCYKALTGSGDRSRICASMNEVIDFFQREAPVTAPRHREPSDGGAPRSGIN